MNLNRRQFLILGGAFGGVGLSIATHRLWATQQVDAQQLDQPPSPAASPSTEPGGMVEVVGVGEVFNPPRGDVRIVTISDLNSQYGSTEYEPEVDKAIALLPVWQPDIVLCGGDMVAGQAPSLTTSEIQAMWAAFDRHVSAPLRQAGIPYGFTLGNHDASSARSIDGGYLFANERDQAAAYWNNPAHEPGLSFVDRAQFPFYYTFQHKGIFGLVWDASSAQISAEQLAWVERSLASEMAQSAKLRLAIGHLPLYAITVGREDPGEYLENAEALRSLLERYQVHTYISGHDHAYYPGHKGKLELLQCGILGSGVRPLLNGEVVPMKTLTIVDVALDQAETTYTTFNMKTMELVNLQQLPRLIASPTGKVLRRDLQEADLTPAEQAIEYEPSA
ncbi:metallophosphoesterase [Phormidium tenue FACHB-886]|nr:metallophosphoesterase [Phormidium tenue FACHB-886]